MTTPVNTSIYVDITVTPETWATEWSADADKVTADELRSKIFNVAHDLADGELIKIVDFSNTMAARDHLILCVDVRIEDPDAFRAKMSDILEGFEENAHETLSLNALAFEALIADAACPSHMGYAFNSCRDVTPEAAKSAPAFLDAIEDNAIAVGAALWSSFAEEDISPRQHMSMMAAQARDAADHGTKSPLPAAVLRTFDAFYCSSIACLLNDLRSGTVEDPETATPRDVLKAFDRLYQSFQNECDDPSGAPFEDFAERLYLGVNSSTFEEMADKLAVLIYENADNFHVLSAIENAQISVLGWGFERITEMSKEPNPDDEFEGQMP